MKYTIYALLIIIFCSCSIQVKTLQKPELDFSQYHSWCWMEGCEPFLGNKTFYNQKAMEEIANAIAFNMNEKGYKQGDENADMIINYYVIVREDSVSLPLNRNNDYQENDWVEQFYPEYDHFLIGTLVIDILDNESNELLWTSKATSYFKPQPTLDKETIWSGVAKTMKKLPNR